MDTGKPRIVLGKLSDALLSVVQSIAFFLHLPQCLPHDLCQNPSGNFCTLHGQRNCFLRDFFLHFNSFLRFFRNKKAACQNPGTGSDKRPVFTLCIFCYNSGSFGIRRFCLSELEVSCCFICSRTDGFSLKEIRNIRP